MLVILRKIETERAPSPILFVKTLLFLCLHRELLDDFQINIVENFCVAKM